MGICLFEGKFWGMPTMLTSFLCALVGAGNASWMTSSIPAAELAVIASIYRCVQLHIEGCALLHGAAEPWRLVHA